MSSTMSRSDVDEADDDRPRGKRSGKKQPKSGSSKTLLIVGCLGCGGITAVGVIAGAVLVAVFVWPFTDGPSKKKAEVGGLLAGGGGAIDKPRPAVQASMANLEKIEFGMTRGEVEAILGSGTAVTEADVSRVQEKAYTKVGNDWKTVAKTSQVNSWAEWRSGSDVIHIGFRQSKAGDLATLKMGVFSSVKIAGATEYHLSSVPGAVDLAGIREAKARDEKLFADGSVKTKDLTAKDMIGKYQFLADDQVKISLPSQFFKGQTDGVIYKVLITQDELMLAPQIGKTIVAGQMYRRGKGASKK